jgi:RNA polymerase sigma-70 factor (ECF subfamily)
MLETLTTLQNESDNDLMMSYRDGDSDAFNELYRRHRVSLFRFIKNSCNTEAVASELFQDVWTSVINARQTYEGAAPFHAWLYRIARNKLTDYYRTNKIQPQTTTLNEDTDTGIAQLQVPLQPDELTDLSNQTSALQSALNTLPPEQRDALLLKHVAGFTLDEIATQFQENAETIKSRLRYATAKLRKQLRVLS